MTPDQQSAENRFQRGRNRKVTGTSSGMYGLAFIGAAIYYIQHATSFWMGVLGFLKACVWPVFVIYKVLEFLKM